MTDTKPLFKCGDCGWEGSELSKVEIVQDLSPGERQPFGACPDCDWWFGLGNMPPEVLNAEQRLERAAPGLRSALRELMEALGGEPNDREPSQGLAWGRAKEALAASAPSPTSFWTFSTDRTSARETEPPYTGVVLFSAKDDTFAILDHNLTGAEASTVVTLRRLRREPAFTLRQSGFHTATNPDKCRDCAAGVREASDYKP